MTRHPMLRTALFMLVGALVVLGCGGCSLTRAQKLADKADEVEDSLVAERDRVLTLEQGAERSTRLDYLRGLNLQLRAANISRAAAPRLLEGEQVELAYDVLEEVYGTIDWNIPLAPSDPQAKVLPSFFGPTGLDFNRLKAAPIAPTPGSNAPAQPAK